MRMRTNAAMSKESDRTPDRDKRLTIEELPFLKRYPFEHEDEFRMVYESKTEEISKLDIRPVSGGCRWPSWHASAGRRRGSPSALAAPVLALVRRRREIAEQQTDEAAPLTDQGTKPVTMLAMP